MDAAVSQIQEKQSDVNSLSLQISELTGRVSEKSRAVTESERQLSEAREEINRLQISLDECEATCSGTKEQAALRLEDFRSQLDLEQKASANLLTQANSNSSDLGAQVRVLSQNCRALQSELDDTTKEFDTVALELVEKQKQGTLPASQMAQSEQRFLATCRDLNEQLESDKKHISVQDKTIAQLTNDVHKQEQTLHESNSRLSQYEQAVSRLTSDLEKRDANLGAKYALVARLENALHGANQSLSGSLASLKEKDDEISALKAMLDSRDAMV